MHVAELIATDVALRPMGRVLVGCCPFHAEKTPSFTVYADHYHCYGCGAHGTLQNYLQRRYGGSWGPSARSLRYQGYARVPAPRTSTPVNPAALSIAMHWYTEDLWSRWVPEGRQYLARRGLLPNGTQSVARHLHLGYCTGARLGMLLRAWADEGITRDDALASGLLVVNAQGKDAEALRGRVIIPEIRQQQVIWVTGRAVGDQLPKYRNLPGPRCLLGHDQLQPDGAVIAVESGTDYLTLRMWGYPAVATVGGTLPATDATAFASVGRVYLVPHRDAPGWAWACRLASLLGSRAWLMALPATVGGQPIKDVNHLATVPQGRALFQEMGRGAVPFAHTTGAVQ